MKHVISSSGHALGKQVTLAEALEILAEAGYEAVDFWLHIYSDGENAPLMQDNWREWTMNARALMEKYRLFPVQCHCRWQGDHPFSEDITLGDPDEIYHRNIEACHILGCRRLIVHPLYYIKRIPDEATRMAVLDANTEWFRKLLPTAERFGVELHLENTFDFGHVQQEGDPDYMCVAAWEMLYMARKLNHPLVKICVDTGHANIARQDVPAMIRETGPMLGSLHLNDNYGLIGPIYEDLHLFPGYGNLNWAEIFKALKEVGYTGAINMEPVGPLMNGDRDGHIVKLKAAREILRLMGERAGFEMK